MRRRGFIVGSGIALSALAGCLGNQQVALSERPPENEVEDGIRIAIGEANTVALQLATAQEDAGSPADVAVDVAALRSQLDGAQAELDSVSQNDAASDYQEAIDAARTYVGIVEGLLDGTASLTDAAGQLEDLEASLQNEDYDAAAQELDGIQPTVDDARSTTTEAQSDADGIDAAALDPYGAKMDELNDGLDTIQNIAVGADELTDGYGSVLTGQEHLEQGGQAYEQGDFATAESEFQAAESAFTTATGHFETARTETDDELDAQIQTALCRSRALTDAARHFEASAAAAQQGDLSTAQSEYDAGEDDVGTAASCG